jgi:hypothetical protein
MRIFSTWIRTLALTAPLALLAAGCDASPEPALAGPEEEETELKDFFGTTGAQVDYLRCPTVAGFFGRAGKFLDSVGLICQSGSSLWRTESFGTVGGVSFSLTCPAGFVGVGISGSSGKHIVSMQLVCSSSTGSQYITEEKGGSTGSSFSFKCAEDQKLIGFNLQDVPYINGIEPVCGPL